MKKKLLLSLVVCSVMVPSMYCMDSFFADKPSPKRRRPNTLTADEVYKTLDPENFTVVSRLGENVVVERSGFFSAIRNGQEGEVIKFLRDPEVDVNLPNLKEKTPIMLAAKLGHAGIVKKLLDANADPCKRQASDTGLSAWWERDDNDEITALEYAAKGNDKGSRLKIVNTVLPYTFDEKMKLDAARLAHNKGYHKTEKIIGEYEFYLTCSKINTLIAKNKN